MRMSRSKGTKMAQEKLDIPFELCDGLTIIERLNDFEIRASRVITKIDLLQAAELRNRLTAWMNSKKSRDNRNAKLNNGNSTLSNVHSSGK